MKYIRINSKDIFEIRNDKLKDNTIKGVDYEQDNCGFINDFNKLVYSPSKSPNEFSKLTTKIDSKVTNQNNCGLDPGLCDGYQVFARLEISYASGRVTIPKKLEDKTITKIYDGVDKDGKPNIHYNIRGEIEKGIAGYNKYRNETPNVNTPPPVDKLTFTMKDKYPYSGQITDFSLTCYDNTPSYNMNVTAAVNDISNLSDIIITENDDNFYFDYVVPYEALYITAQGKWSWQEAHTTTNGEYKKITCKKLEFSIYGDLYSFDVQKEKITVGTTPSNFKLENNELLQRDTNFIDSYGEGTPIGEWLGKEIIKDYKNGKETAEILCQIGEYYHGYDNTLAISTKDETKPMIFNVGDEVIPYVLNAKGEDVAISYTRKKDWAGNFIPKKFLVVGVEIIYNGVPMQKLTLQEISIV